MFKRTTAQILPTWVQPLMGARERSVIADPQARLYTAGDLGPRCWRVVAGAQSFAFCWDRRAIVG